MEEPKNFPESDQPDKKSESLPQDSQKNSAGNDGYKPFIYSGESPKSEKPRKPRTVSLTTFVSALLVLAIVAGIFAFTLSAASERRGYYQGLQENVTTPPENTESGKYSELEFFDQFFSALAYDDVSDVDFLTAVLKAYVAATGDRYAEYYTKEEFEAMTAENAGNAVGIGVSVVYSPVAINGVTYQALEIITVMPDSPALLAGVCPGDYVLYVGIGEDRELVQEIGYTESVSRLRGEKGTAAEFTVFRPASDGTFEEKKFSILRDNYTSVSVQHHISALDPTVGIVKLIQFDLTTPKQFSAAMDDLISQGIKKFVFDVRYNPGGDLQSIIAVLSYFLNENDIILSTKDKSGNETVYRVSESKHPGEYAQCDVSKEEIGKYRGYTCAVLTNGGTASAAELFTANMRDYGLGTLVGTTTYGKGSMQSIYDLSQWKLEGGIKLTTRHYFPPCGVGYDGIGIEPDITVDLSEEAKEINIYKLEESQDDQLKSAIRALYPQE